MTVCISVTCDWIDGRIPKVVCISDTQLSLGITSTRTLKARGLGQAWSVMFAGNDISYAEEVLGLAVQKCGGGPTAQVSYLEAYDAMTKAYQDTRRRQIEHRYLGTFGLSMADFLKQGSDFPSSSYRQYLLNEMSRFDLGCQFLVSGFASATAVQASIFEIHNPGQAIPQDIMGNSAIGSGSINALTYLARRSQNAHKPLEESLYNAIAAKKLAEKALGVGGETVVIVLERGKENVNFLADEKIDAITKIWLDEEAEVRPKDFRKRVAAIFTPPPAQKITPPPALPNAP